MGAGWGSRAMTPSPSGTARGAIARGQRALRGFSAFRIMMVVAMMRVIMMMIIAVRAVMMILVSMVAMWTFLMMMIVMVVGCLMMLFLMV